MRETGRCGKWARQGRGWLLAGGALAGLVALVLPARKIGLAREDLRGLIGSYLYAQGTAYDAPVRNLRCSDVYLPKTIRLDWDYLPFGSDALVHYEVQRATSSSGPWTSFGTTITTQFYIDTFSWTSGTSYYYRVRVVDEVVSDPNRSLPAPPVGADPSQVYYYGVPSGQPWRTIRVVPIELTASDAQTVDSRYDLRYATATYLDFMFGSGTYRGGLYAGYAADPSRVGRSFLKFQYSALPTNTYLWTANVHAYYLRSAANGTTTVGMQQVSDSWSGSALKWSTAPSLTAGSPQASVSCSYDSASPVSAWKKWPLDDAIGPQIVGSGLFSAGMASTSEGSGGWTYFAKAGYDSSLGPRSLYAYGDGDSVEEFRITLSPSTVHGGNSSTGTVTFTTGAPSGGRAVSLASGGSAATVPSSVTMPAGAKSATFTVTTSAVGSATSVWINGGFHTSSAAGLLTITP